MSISTTALSRSMCGVIAFVDAMTCEACEAETQARHIARGKRSATPGCHQPPPSCILCGCIFYRVTLSVGYAIAHPRLNPVGFCLRGHVLRTSMPTAALSLLMWRHYRGCCAMTCEACEAETQARHIARGKRSTTPGYHHPHQPGVRIGRELHIIPGHNRL